MKAITVLPPVLFFCSFLSQVLSQTLPCPVGSSCTDSETACLAALQLSGFDPADIDNYERWWNVDGYVIVAETGTYAGMDSVKEYMSYGTGGNGVYYDWSVPDGDRYPLVLSAAPGDDAGAGECEVAFVSTFVYDYDEPAAKRYTKGGKVSATVMGIYKYAYSELNPAARSANIAIEYLRGFYPTTFWAVAASLHDTKTFRKLLCKTLRKSCSDIWEENNYCRKTCMTELEALPLTDVYIHTEAAADETFGWKGASIGCRQLHLAFVVDGNPKHCPHISGIPLEDANGVIKCQDGGSKQVTAEELFTETELGYAHFIGQNLLGFDTSLLFYEPPAE